MKTATPPPPQQPVYSTRVRKPKRRPMHNSVSRSRTRADRHAPHDPAHRSSSPLSNHKSPNTNRTRSNSPSASLKWTSAQLAALAEEVHRADSVDASVIFTGKSMPDSLRQKTSVHITAALTHLTTIAEPPSFAASLNLSASSHAFAAMASEMAFMAAQKKQRDAALAVLSKARAERIDADKTRQRLLADSKALSHRVKEERDRRQHANSTEKPRLESRLEQQRSNLQAAKTNSALLLDNLERAKIGELEVRRKLDRMRLKVAAMRGEMVIATVDKLQRASKRWFGDYDDPTFSPLQPLDGNAMSNGHGQSPKTTDVSPVAATDRTDSPSNSLTKFEMELDESAEEIEFRLLKNRFAMVEAEAREWNEYADEQKEQVRLIERSKAKLEEELAHQKQSGGNKSTTTRNGGKNAASARATAKLRAAVRATLPIATDMASRVRKSRKSRPTRSLMRDLYPE